MNTDTQAGRLLAQAAAAGLRYAPRVPPSKWLARNGRIAAAASEQGGAFDVWYWPLNVGIIDAALEPKRGILVRKPVQVGMSHYMMGLLCWGIRFVGGPFAYAMAKDDTVREHVLDRLEPILDHSPDLVPLQLRGRDNHEAILSKRFTTATLKLFGTGSVNNFISNPYVWAFADEFERMDQFDGADAVTLFMGRQASFGFPKLFGWSTPLETGEGITRWVEERSDRRRFHVLCPHCHEPITFDWHRDVRFRRHLDNGRPVAESAELLCQLCRHAITDSERAGAILHAAQAACPWYTAVPFDDRLGWQSTLPPEQAAAADFAGIEGWSHLYNHRKYLHETARQWCGITTERQRKVFYNDTLGEAYTVMAQVVTPEMLQARVANETRTAVPAGTLWVTFGSDVQGGGVTGDLVFYYDISAWVPSPHGVRKVCLEVDRIKGTLAADFDEVKTLVRQWRGIDDSGGEYRITTACFDAGYRTKYVYAICNDLCRGQRAQWCLPVIYSSEKVGEADTRYEPQGDGVGDPGRMVLLTSRDHAVGRAIERLTQSGLVELPRPLKPEIERHYLANIQIEDYDRAGNFRGHHWVKKQLAKGYREDDDWLQAAAYCELAAVQLGLDRQAAQVVAGAKQAAAGHAESRRSANTPDGGGRDWIQRSRRLFRGRHGYQKA